MATFFTYCQYCSYHGLSSPNLRSRFRWISTGIARSEVRNGLPAICRIRMNVMKMTSRITGIVQIRRLMMNFVTTDLSYPAADRATLGIGRTVSARSR